MFVKMIIRKGKMFLVPYNSMGNGAIILMGMPSSIHILTAVLNIKKRDPRRGAKALAIARACSIGTWVIVDLGTLTALFADIAEFNLAKGEAKKTIWDRINGTLKSIMRQFQSASENDPINSREIIESGGFRVKKVHKKQEQVFGLIQGPSGTVLLTGDTIESTHLHDWWISENGTDFVRMDPTTESTTQATGLIVGKRYWFKHQFRTPVGQKNGPLKTLYIDVV